MWLRSGGVEEVEGERGQRFVVGMEADPLLGHGLV